MLFKLSCGNFTAIFSISKELRVITFSQNKLYMYMYIVYFLCVYNIVHAIMPVSFDRFLEVYLKMSFNAKGN